MTNSKITRRALLISFVALMLCLAMLTGTTFAWFTDQETSANNKIVAGDLDVQLLMYDETAQDYVDIGEESDPIFGADGSLIAQNNNLNTLWEPGKTQVAYLAIKNNGSLALKYKVELEVEEADTKKLYEVMSYAITPGAQNVGVTAWDAANAKSIVLGTQAVSGEVELEKGITHYFALSVHMDENAGNSYENAKISFDLTVYATQLNVEPDAFGPDYDANSQYTSGGSANVPAGKLDANNKLTEVMTVSTTDNSATATLPIGTKLADGVTEVTLTTAAAEPIINSGTLYANAYAIDITVDGLADDNTEPVTVVKKAALPTGLTNVVAYHKGEELAAFSYDPTTGDISVTVTNFCNFTFASEALTLVSDGLYKDSQKNVYVYNAEGLAALNTIMAGSFDHPEINIMNNIDFTGKTWTPVDAHVDWNRKFSTINGNGHTISNLTINGRAMFTRFSLGTGVTVTIKDVTFDNATINSSDLNTSIICGQTYNDVILDNVDVKNSTITGAYKVAPLIATVYNETPSTVTATLKNCDVSNTTVKSTSYDFCTAGMVAFVYEGNNDKIEFENCTVTDVQLFAKPNGYASHAAIYVNDADTDDCFNEAEGVTVTNVTFEALN